MSALPTVKGFGPIPLHLKVNNGLHRAIVRELRTDQALVLEYASSEQAKDGQKSMLMAGQRELGQGKVETAVQENTLYIWLRGSEPSAIQYLEKNSAEPSHE